MIRTSVRVMEVGGLLEAIAAMREAYDTVASYSADTATHPDYQGLGIFTKGVGFLPILVLLPFFALRGFGWRGLAPIDAGAGGWRWWPVLPDRQPRTALATR